MHRIILLLTMLAAFSAFGSDEGKSPFTYESAVGEWQSNWASVKGEVQILSIKNDGATIFKRRFENGKEIEVVSSRSDMQVLDDILLVSYRDDEFGIRYKLLLSGWHVTEGGSKASAMYGMLFLYQNGRQFNGFPVSFRPAN